jgi:hypothetical protein
VSSLPTSPSGTEYSPWHKWYLELAPNIHVLSLHGRNMLFARSKPFPGSIELTVRQTVEVGLIGKG